MAVTGKINLAIFLFFTDNIPSYDRNALPITERETKQKYINVKMLLING